MNRATRDFVCKEPRTFSFKIGHHVASSLTGFIAGIVAASILWTIGVWYFGQVRNTASYITATHQTSSVPTAPLQEATQKPSTH